jgi:hypothetical protein
MCKATGISLERGNRVVVMVRQRRSGRGTGAAFADRRAWKFSVSKNAPDAEALANRLKEWIGCRSGAGSLLAARPRSRAATFAT